MRYGNDVDQSNLATERMRHLAGVVTIVDKQQLCKSNHGALGFECDCGNQIKTTVSSKQTVVFICTLAL